MVGLATRCRKGEAVENIRGSKHALVEKLRRGTTDGRIGNDIIVNN